MHLLFFRETGIRMATQLLATAPATATVDMRGIPPRERHPLISSTFRTLPTGRTLELINDHDPRPLYDHFQAERPGGFGWDYVERGPVWRVRMTKIDTVAGQHGQDFCCGACGGT
jgi:uncharacterized protein (DUF2249 family)